MTRTHPELLAFMHRDQVWFGLCMGQPIRRHGWNWLTQPT